MANNKEQIYIPKRKIKKAYYLEFKRLHEEQLHGKALSSLTVGELEKAIQGSYLNEDYPDLKLHMALYLRIVDSNPENPKITMLPGEELPAVSEGIHYWIMKENGTLPVRKKATPSPSTEKTLEEPSSTTEFTTQTMIEKEPETRKEKFGKRLIRLFGF